MRILRGTPPDDIDNVVSFIQRYVNELTDHGFVEGSDPVRLTEKGADLTEDQAAAAKVLHEQFASSLQGRARTICGGNEGAAKKVALAAEGFLGSCVEHRALGVSMTLHSPR